MPSPDIYIHLHTSTYTHKYHQRAGVTAVPGILLSISWNSHFRLSHTTELNPKLRLNILQQVLTGENLRGMRILTLPGRRRVILFVIPPISSNLAPELEEWAANTFNDAPVSPATRTLTAEDRLSARLRCTHGPSRKQTHTILRRREKTLSMQGQRNRTPKNGFPRDYIHPDTQKNISFHSYILQTPSGPSLHSFQTLCRKPPFW